MLLLWDSRCNKGYLIWNLRLIWQVKVSNSLHRLKRARWPSSMPLVEMFISLSTSPLNSIWRKRSITNQQWASSTWIMRMVEEDPSHRAGTLLVSSPSSLTWIKVQTWMEIKPILSPFRIAWRAKTSVMLVVVTAYWAGLCMGPPKTSVNNPLVYPGIKITNGARRRRISALTKNKTTILL